MNAHRTRQAIAYAVGMLGSSADEGYCLRFVAAAYGVPPRWSSALAFAERLRELELLQTETPPPCGALAFYAPPDAPYVPAEFRGTGHVTLSLGAGWQISTSWPRYPGTVGITRHGHYAGYLGWAPAAVLVSHYTAPDTAATNAGRGAGDPFDTAGPVLGPWFDAAFDGQCTGCWDRIGEGERIRADGEGGWLCTDCGEEV